MDYLIRKSHFSLIEISLLARSLERSRVPAAGKEPSQEVLTKTMLEMKSSEKSGNLMVAIHGENPVGFVWTLPNGDQVSWVETGHNPQIVLEKIKGSL